MLRICVFAYLRVHQTDFLLGLFCIIARYVQQYSPFPLVAGLRSHVHAVCLFAIKVRVCPIDVPPDIKTGLCLKDMLSDVVDTELNRADEVPSGYVLVISSYQKSVIHGWLWNWDEKCLVDLAVHLNFRFHFFARVIAGEEWLHRVLKLEAPHFSQDIGEQR